MTRQILERLVLVALPFAAYALYLMLRQLFPPGPQRAHPWAWLLIAGLVLFAASFIVWGITEGEPTTGTYVAPHVVDGKIVPGYVKPSDKKP
jgi:hypothetical protein